jgi:hypothetical protein
MDGNEEHHLKWSKPGSKGQSLHGFPHLWKLDLKEKCIQKYMYYPIYGIYIWNPYIFDNIYMWERWYICERDREHDYISESVWGTAENFREGKIMKHIAPVYEDNITQ